MPISGHIESFNGRTKVLNNDSVGRIAYVQTNRLRGVRGWPAGHVRHAVFAGILPSGIGQIDCFSVYSWLTSALTKTAVVGD